MAVRAPFGLSQEEIAARDRLDRQRDSSSDEERRGTWTTKDREPATVVCR